MVAPSPAPGEEQSLGFALVNAGLVHRSEPVDLLAGAGTVPGWLEARGPAGRWIRRASRC